MISNKGLEIIKKYEGYSDTVYRCPAGYLTWGYGSRYYKGEPITWNFKYTKEQAEEQLKLDTEHFENTVLGYVRVGLFQEQLDALISLSYNIGGSAFKKSTLLRKLNEGDYVGASKEFKKWNRGGGRVLPGLIKRREAEKELFCEGINKHKETTEYFANLKPRGLNGKSSV